MGAEELVAEVAVAVLDVDEVEAALPGAPGSQHVILDQPPDLVSVTSPQPLIPQRIVLTTRPPKASAHYKEIRPCQPSGNLLLRGTPTGHGSVERLVRY